MSSTLHIIDAGRSAYEPVLAMQQELVAKRKADEIADTLILVEHEPVYTLGRNADDSNILASREELEEQGIDVVRIGRGGDVTFHGPGQLVGYPLLKLSPPGKGVLWYIRNLEDVLIRVLTDFGIDGERNSANRGVWVGESKIAALGVRVTGHVTMHGFALNVTTDLRYYAGIVPCGLVDKGVLSMQILKPDIQMAEVKARVIERFKEVFEYV